MQFNLYVVSVWLFMIIELLVLIIVFFMLRTLFTDTEFKAMKINKPLLHYVYMILIITVSVLGFLMPFKMVWDVAKKYIELGYLLSI
jgi:hypothetical protein